MLNLGVAGLAALGPAGRFLKRGLKSTAKIVVNKAEREAASKMSEPELRKIVYQVGAGLKRLPEALKSIPGRSRRLLSGAPKIPEELLHATTKGRAKNIAGRGWDSSQEGAYYMDLTGPPGAAYVYEKEGAVDWSKAMYGYGGHADEIMQVQHNMKKPFVVENRDDVLAMARKMDVPTTDQNLEAIGSIGFQKADWEKLKQKGYDGAIFRNTEDIVLVKRPPKKRENILDWELSEDSVNAWDDNTYFDSAVGGDQVIIFYPSRSKFVRQSTQ
jgi:hypothetical protein